MSDAENCGGRSSGNGLDTAGTQTRGRGRPEHVQEIEPMVVKHPFE